MVTVTGHFSPLFLYGNTMKQRLQIERGTSAVFLRYEMGGAANLENISEFFWDVVDLLGLHLPFTVQMNWNTEHCFHIFSDCWFSRRAIYEAIRVCNHNFQVIQSGLFIQYLEVTEPFKGSLHHPKRVRKNCYCRLVCFCYERL